MLVHHLCPSYHTFHSRSAQDGTSNIVPLCGRGCVFFNDHPKFPKRTKDVYTLVVSHCYRYYEYRIENFIITILLPYYSVLNYVTTRCDWFNYELLVIDFYRGWCRWWCLRLGGTCLFYILCQPWLWPMDFFPSHTSISGCQSNLLVSVYPQFSARELSLLRWYLIQTQIS